MTDKANQERRYFEFNNLLNRPVNGQIPLEKDKEAVDNFIKSDVIPKSYFIKNANQYTNIIEKMQYLIENDYLDEILLKNYSSDFIKSLFAKVEAFEFKFNSFMGIYKFYKQYCLKDNENKYYLEDYKEHCFYNALALSEGNEQTAEKLINLLLNRIFQPATPTFMNAGRSRAGELVSCFLISITDDMNAIGRNINSALQLSKIGGGVGINLSNLREAGAPIKGRKDAASGVIPVMKILEDSFSYANQLGQRNGAGVVYLNVFHPDILEFLSAKKENADEKIRVKTLSLGVVVPDKFYELCRNDEEMYLFSPYTVQKEFGISFSKVDITAEYENMLKNERIMETAKKIKARNLELEISKLQQESGYPYILNVDTANRENPVHGRIFMSNLCTEILQVQNDSIIADEQTYDELGTDISCNLGSLNLVNLVNSNINFGEIIETSVRALTYVTTKSEIKTVPTVNNGNKLYHSIGLGAMGLHHLFAINHIDYGSKASLELTDILFEAINFYSIVASNKIAQEKNQKFFEFEKSKYATGEYFEKYLNSDEKVISPEVAKILSKVPIPTKEDWLELKEKVVKYGLFHSYRLAVAPTGSISYINETTASLHPITQRIEERQEKKVGKIYFPAPGLSNDTISYYKTAYEISMISVIDIYATAQKHIDQGMSLTLFMKSIIPEGMYPWKDKTYGQYGGKLTTRDLNILRNYAHNKGIKTLYYVRTYTSDGEEVGSNMCESCSI